MATRFAGDFFGIPLTTPQEDQGSTLFDYFPDLKTIRKGSQVPTGQSDLGPARLMGGAQAVTPFTGFKTFEVSNERKAAPLFSGFKTFEQPSRENREAESSRSTKQSSVFAAKPTKETVQVDEEVLKKLGLA